MANEMNFAETVMLVDAAYLNRVCGDLKKHFSTVLGRELPAGADGVPGFGCRTTIRGE